MSAIIDVFSWDLIEAADGGVVVIIPPSPSPRCLLIAADALYVGTAAATLRLVGSARLRAIVARARLAIVAEADDMIRRETLVPIRNTSKAFGPVGSEYETGTARVAA